MFNELSLSQVETILDARIVLEAFVKSSIKARELGFTEIRLHENSLANLYQLSLLDGYRIDNWLNDAEVSSDLRLRFKDIIANPPLIKDDEQDLRSVYEWSIFHIILNQVKHQVFGLGAAYVFGTLAISLGTHEEWAKPKLTISHTYLTLDGAENTDHVEINQFSNEELLLSHKVWIEKEKKDSLEKTMDLWEKRTEYFPNIFLGTDVERQLLVIGLTKRFYQVVDCFNKLNDFAGKWHGGGFNLNELKSQSFLDISGESDCTKKKYPLLRQFRLHDGQKAQFDLHIKIPELRIYFLPNVETHKITVGYVGKHLRTCKFE